jgi:hypothetical protein
MVLLMVVVLLWLATLLVTLVQLELFSRVGSVGDDHYLWGEKPYSLRLYGNFSRRRKTLMLNPVGLYWTFMNRTLFWSWALYKFLCIIIITKDNLFRNELIIFQNELIIFWKIINWFWKIINSIQKRCISSLKNSARLVGIWGLKECRAYLKFYRNIFSKFN